MPNPKQGESKKDFISRAIPIIINDAKSKGKKMDSDQAAAIASSMFDRKKTKHKQTQPFFSVVKTKEEDSDIEVKENEDGSYTFIIASTLPDRVREQLPDGTIIEGEILSKNVLDKFTNFINDDSRLGGKYGSYRTVSLFHDRVIMQDPHRS